MGVESQNCNAGCNNTKILNERAIEHLQSANNALLCEVCAHLRYGKVDGGECHTQILATHNHHRLALALSSQKLGMAGVGEVLSVHIFLVDGGGDEQIQITCIDILHRLLQCCNSHRTRLGSCSAYIDTDILWATLHKIHTLGSSLGSRLYKRYGEVLHTLDATLVKCKRLCRAIHNGDDIVVDAAIGKCFDNHLCTDAAKVACGDTCTQNSILTHILFFCFSRQF